jgi:hypothetical protein
MKMRMCLTNLMFYQGFIVSVVTKASYIYRRVFVVCFNLFSFVFHWVLSVKS